jgi:hypothetical protein
MKATQSSEPVFLCAQTPSEFGTVGLPIELSREGVTVRVDALSEEEREVLHEVGKLVQDKIDKLVRSVAAGR